MLGQIRPPLRPVVLGLAAPLAMTRISPNAFSVLAVLQNGPTHDRVTAVPQYSLARFLVTTPKNHFRRSGRGPGTERRVYDSDGR